MLRSIGDKRPWALRLLMVDICQGRTYGRRGTHFATIFTLRDGLIAAITEYGSLPRPTGTPQRS